MKTVLDSASVKSKMRAFFYESWCYYIPSVLPSESYADVSHPLSEGYALLAEQLFDNDIGRGSW